MNRIVRNTFVSVALPIVLAALPLQATAQTAQATAPVIAPEPAITGLAPLSVVAGGPAFRLTVKGTGFTADATVYWNNTEIPTTVVSSTEVYAIIPDALRKSVGYAAITVHQGDAITSQVALALHAAAPALRSVQPASVPLNAGPLALIVTGANFTAKSVLVANGVELPTTYISAKDLQATLSATQTTAPGFLRLQVRQGGILSKSLVLVVGTSKPTSAPTQHQPTTR